MTDVPMGGTWHGKSRAEEADADDEYDGEESASVTDERKSVDAEKGSDCLTDDLSEAGGVEKKAAWLLMNLSVQDGEGGSCKGDSLRELVVRKEELLDGPRVKRRRANSM
jgi:hypothetical protein